MSKFLDLNGLSHFNDGLNEKLVLVADELITATTPQPNIGQAFMVEVEYIDTDIPVGYYHTTAPLENGVILYWPGIMQSMFNTVVTTTLGSDGYYLETVSCTSSGFTMNVSRKSLLPNDDTTFDLYGYSYSTSGNVPSGYPNALHGTGYLFRPDELDTPIVIEDLRNAVPCGFSVRENSVYYLQANSLVCTPQYKPCGTDPELTGGLITPPTALYPGLVTVYREVIQ